MQRRHKSSRRGNSRPIYQHRLPIKRGDAGSWSLPRTSGDSIIAATEQLMRGHTSFMIAQRLWRLAAARLADESHPLS